MATFVKFQDFVSAILREEHNLEADAFKIALTNTAPVNTQTDFDAVTNHAAPAAANGYTSGGTTIGSSAGASVLKVSASGGTVTVEGNEVTFTASGGNLGPFRYAVMYNDTHSTDGLVGYWDYGSSITLANTETFKVRFNNDATDGTIFTLS